MTKRRRSAKLRLSKRILPIDERIFPDIISFSHIKGVARIFLIIEMTCAVLVVLGTFSLLLFRGLIR